MARVRQTLDGNEAAAGIAYKCSDVIAIYPITPASPMGEWADQWASLKERNLWDSVPDVIEMQSEGGAAGAVHGSLQSGALTTTFTASQGLLLMIPNMYKIAGELTPAVFHIAARSVAAQALSIFGDHSDVMAARATGWAMLFASNVQEVMDMAVIAHAATLEARIPFLHVFDGFRTSHELQRIDIVTDETLRAMLDQDAIDAFRGRRLSPEHPVIRGTAQNPDVFFQARESVNSYYMLAPAIVQGVMDRFATLTGRHYHPFDYHGAPDAERVIVVMGSGSETARHTAVYLAAHGEKVGVLTVRLFRPFDASAFISRLPETVRSIAVLDRTKEPGSAGEPLYQDVVVACNETLARAAAPFAEMPRIIGGRYGLSSKEFTPGMVRAVFDELKAEAPRREFTVGIHDDVTRLSLAYSHLDIEPEGTRQAVFWGLGSDGTVGANKNSIKIIADNTNLNVQGYFVYDSRKAGARTISHLRFGPHPIESPYLITGAEFVSVHQFDFLERYDTLACARPGATLLLNCPYEPSELWNQIPSEVTAQIIDLGLRVFVIDAYALAREAGLGGRINTIMQTCFFALTNIVDTEEAIGHIRKTIRDTYGKRGEAVVERNLAAVDVALSGLHEVPLPSRAPTVGGDGEVSRLDGEVPPFVLDVTEPLLRGKGESLPVSAFPVDGTYPVGTTRYERRNLAPRVPVWEPDICIQCGKCVIACPHAVIRSKIVSDADLAGAPADFLAADARWREFPDLKYTLQVAVEDCTGCELCVEICPAHDKSNVSRRAVNMASQRELRERGREHWAFFRGLPEEPPQNGASLRFTKSKDVQLLEPLFEFSSACAGCGETPYLILASRLFGDHMLIANATGCSSIYGGNLPTTPWTSNRAGKGPAWSNSLFEDNAEFGLGMRVAADRQAAYARELVEALKEDIGSDLASDLLAISRETETAMARELVHRLRERLTSMNGAKVRDLAAVADMLIPQSVWIIGGDGWAYDIGYGGLDHVLASGKNVNILVLDTEVYSNTGGQASKSTSLGAVAKFAAAGKRTPKKDLARLAMEYGYVYVATVAMGYDENQTIRAFREAESYDGPSIIIAYSHCIAHGIDMIHGFDQHDRAVKSGYWPLFRYDPRVKETGGRPFQLDSKPPSISFEEYAAAEARFSMLSRSHPEVAAELHAAAQKGIRDRWKDLAAMAAGPSPATPAAKPARPAGKLPPGYS
jgi:pyruvate-ferredoxin/flavodoxin oxidoreductase